MCVAGSTGCAYKADPSIPPHPLASHHPQLEQQQQARQQQQQTLDTNDAATAAAHDEEDEEGAHAPAQGQRRRSARLSSQQRQRRASASSSSSSLSPGVVEEEGECTTEAVAAGLVFVKSWTKTRHAVILRLSNGWVGGWGIHWSLRADGGWLSMPA